MVDFSQIRSLVVYALVIGVLLICMLGLGAFTGIRRTREHMGRALSTPFESGIIPTGSAHLRLPVQYYLVAMFFVIFDVETAFLFTWAIVVTDVGWIGYSAAVLFIFFLAVSLAYLWRAGGLDWGPLPRRIPQSPTGMEHAS
ncbi:NADH-quinone oxidoreductase subunit A [Acetobacter tropicalis NRIC 0312]|jgi:NADH-quinone oxidoreductase subunit A|uniref:NADH-quinone oxidoreductase subunit A n=1 Tax=Acetobacter tropicalis TaxID=104102 RepID=A0A0C9LU06_9PROT|nr:NADH-quinone oxidoreductase subunit A [Acetobacter tropicalis]KXV47347.1 NADH-quinone oxidoreductase subunit A [Acetobacter tropicalis]OUI87351.1 NADH-quinone oxidoreductase subunit A [Acetobacter tropicalis]GAL99261.1 NADH-quinone oxidoreductase subunit A [Acetobacter tropicalis]GBR67104.1 NADH-quinone oxidoreductase subunit A [Acetobacter tropicalis NRIC 0312]GEL50309.1 NADH-quinone oxidoreductase subunit A [Acetobacter tropicalis]